MINVDNLINKDNSLLALVRRAVDDIRNGVTDAHKLPVKALDFLYKWDYIEVEDYTVTLTEKGNRAEF